MKKSSRILSLMLAGILTVNLPAAVYGAETPDAEEFLEYGEDGTEPQSESVSEIAQETASETQDIEVPDTDFLEIAVPDETEEEMPEAEEGIEEADEVSGDTAEEEFVETEDAEADYDSLEAVSAEEAGSTETELDNISAYGECVSSGTCGSDVFWEIYRTTEDDTNIYTLVISGEGRMDDYYKPATTTGPETFEELPWGYTNVIRKIIVNEGVTYIGARAFRNMDVLTEVVFPESVTAIGNGALVGCPSLQSVNIPEGVSEIPASMFSRCTALTEIQLPQGLKTIGESAFSSSGLISVQIPDTVTSMGERVFSQCESLTSAHLPFGLKEIPDKTFYFCSALTEVDFPSAPTNIGVMAFYETGLTSVTLPESVEIIRTQAFESRQLVEMTITGNLTTMGQCAFGNSDFTKLSRIHYPCFANEVAYYANNIDERSFVGISSKCEMIADHEEDEGTVVKEPDCTNPGSKKYACKYQCGQERFEELPALGHSFTDYKEDPLLNAVAAQCDRNCGAEDVSEFFPDEGFTTDDIVYYEKSGDFSLRLLKNDDGTTYTLVLRGNGILPAGVNGSVYPGTEFAKSSVTRLIIHEGITGIELSPFSGYDHLAEVELPEVMEYIGIFAFSGCKALQKVRMPKQLNWIGEYAFSDCTSLRSIEIPEGLGTIGVRAFDNCSSLEEITVYGCPADPMEEIFRDCSSLVKASVLCKAEAPTKEWLNEYGINDISVFHRWDEGVITKERNCGQDGSRVYTCAACGAADEEILPATNEHRFLHYSENLKLGAIAAPCENGCGQYDIREYLEKEASGEAAEGIFWALYGGNRLCITGEGDIPDYDADHPAPWQDLEIACVQIDKGITGIGKNAFTGTNASELRLPSTLTTMSESAIAFCGKLEKVTVEEGNTSFSVLDGLLMNKEQSRVIFCPRSRAGSITLPESVNRIGYGAFNGCSALSEIIVPDGVTEFDASDSPFENCAPKLVVEVPYSVRTISLSQPDGGLVVRSYDNSDAAYYAKKNGIDFESLGEYAISWDNNHEHYYRAYRIIYNQLYDMLGHCYEFTSLVSGQTFVTTLEISGGDRIVVTYKQITKTDNASLTGGIMFILKPDCADTHNYTYIMDGFWTGKGTSITYQTYGWTTVPNTALQSAGTYQYGFEIQVADKDTADETWHQKNANTMLRNGLNSADLIMKSEFGLSLNDLGYTNFNSGYPEHIIVTEGAREASCTEAGQSGKQYCSICGAVRHESEEIPAKGHQWDSGTVTKNATKEEEGVRTFTCTVCGQTRTERIPKLDGSDDTGSGSEDTGNRSDDTGNGTGRKESQSTTSGTGNTSSVPGQKKSGTRRTDVKKAATVKPVLTLNFSGTLPLKKKQTSKAVKITESKAVKGIIAVSGNTKIVDAKVSGSAIVLKAKKKTGTATVTVKATGTDGKTLTKSFKVKVQKGTVKTKNIKISPKTIRLSVKKSYTLQPELNPLSSTQKITYKSSNKRIAKVSKKGVIKALKKGKATITVMSGKKKVNVKVIVN